MENLTFKISSGLKNIIGRELITDKTIAIFELVKNSYDAGATKVDISFNNIYSEEASISISDNGKGMNKDDIINKWLFVAYSEKKTLRTSAHLDAINASRTYAGAKGIGRFSCDRLGAKLDLYSKKETDEVANLLNVDWDDFEKDSKEEFDSVNVLYSSVDKLPSNYTNGTLLHINNLRERWNREDILTLKKALVKLVNPYENSNDVFEIYLHCDDEALNDKIQKDEKKVINGTVKNYVFETLNLKTTQISISVSDDGNLIQTKMSDRGVFLFELQQESKFRHLKSINIELFYLNKAAKINFRKVMGVSPLEFGSIFVYKNGFRIMPYGEPASDLFNIDRRKTQGYNRFLGTRDLMGRIVVLGDNPDFIETSSRDGGFIKNEAYDELIELYMKFAHAPLEKYVVNLIKWGDELNDGERAVSPEDIKEDIIKYITNYEKKGELSSISINNDLFDIIENNKDKYNSDLVTEIRDFAKKYNDKNLEGIAEKIERKDKQTKRMQSELSKKVEKTEHELRTKEKELEYTKKQTIFLRGLTNPKYENATESLHLMNTYAKSIKLNINKIIKEIKSSTDKKLSEKIQNSVYAIVSATQKINGTYTFAFSADYDIKKQIQTVNLYDFLNEYINNALFSKTGEFIKVNFESGDTTAEVKINPLEFSMIIENLIYNSYKARAKTLNISINNRNDYVFIKFSDDGVGISNEISNKENIFDLGFSTTGGTGVGLAYAKKTINSWGGDIYLSKYNDKGFSVEVKLKNEH